MTPHCPTTSSLRIHQVAPVTARYANDYWFHVVHMRAVCYTCYKTEAIYFNARWNKAEAPPSFLLLSMFLCAFSSSIQDFSSSDSTNASACCAEGELYHPSCKESLFHIVSASFFFLTPDHEPRETLSFSYGKGNVHLALLLFFFFFYPGVSYAWCIR